MSKTNPNQEYYKTAGRTQSDGPDRADATLQEDKHGHAKEQFGKDPTHPAVRRAKKK